MKKFFSATLLVISLNCFSQTSKWFVTFSAAPVVGGTAASLKSQMKAQGYDDDAESIFVIFGDGHTSYPHGGATALLVRGGKSITERKSLYFVAGLTEKATVEGFDAQGWSDGIFGLFAGTYGVNVSVSYTTYQATAGYMYSFPNSRAKLGFGPSVYFLNYKTSYEFSSTGNSHTAVVPGGTFTARFPFGKEKKLCGIEFVFEGNMAPPVKMKSDIKEGFQPKKANMFSFNAGLALAFRKK